MVKVGIREGATTVTWLAARTTNYTRYYTPINPHRNAQVFRFPGRTESKIAVLRYRRRRRVRGQSSLIKFTYFYRLAKFN